MHPITGIAILDWFLSFLDSWGYVLVFCFTIVENLFVIGSFTPGETVVMAAAFLSTPQQGTLTLWMVWVSSVIGTVIGSNLSYYFGRRGGRDALIRYGRKFHISEARIVGAEEYFYQHGSKTVFLSRFAAGFKNFVPVIAGVSRMPLAYFEGWTVLGAITYTSLMCAVGYFVGENFDKAVMIGRQISIFGIVVFLVVIFAAVIGRRKWMERYEEAGEEILALESGESEKDGEDFAHPAAGTDDR